MSSVAHLFSKSIWGWIILELLNKPSKKFWNEATIFGEDAIFWTTGPLFWPAIRDRLLACQVGTQEETPWNSVQSCRFGPESKPTVEKKYLDPLGTICGGWFPENVEGTNLQPRKVTKTIQFWQKLGVFTVRLLLGEMLKKTRSNIGGLFGSKRSKC